jgi:hypothetical protein
VLEVISFFCGNFSNFIVENIDFIMEFRHKLKEVEIGAIISFLVSFSDFIVEHVNSTTEY